MDSVKIGLLGLGTVGSGVFKIITTMPDWDVKLGTKLEIKKILVKDIHKKRNLIVDKHLLTTDYEEILQDDEIKIVIEVVGGSNLPKVLSLRH